MRSGAGVTPDWVHSEALPQLAGAMETLGSSNPASNGGPSSMLRAAPQQQLVPNLDAWGVQHEGSSAGHSWQPQPSSNVTGWSGTGGPPPSESVLAANAPSQVAALGSIGGAPHPYFPVATIGSRGDDDDDTLLVSAEPPNGSDPQPAASYLSGATFESSDEPRMVAVTGQVEMGLGGGRPSPAEAASIFLSSPSPPSGELGDVLLAPSAPAPPPTRPAPKKKSGRARAPKKKAKAPVAPVRRTLKVKKRHPPEVPLGANGRERAMAMLRMLVNSPLSEEFQRPVIQMHPEVRL